MSDFISEEIVVGVLKRLPVESLVRSRCVCKWWKQLIDSQSFILDHLTVQKPRFLVLNVFYELEPYFLLLDPQTLPLADTLPHSFKKGGLALMGTLHGIVCFYTSCGMTDGIYLWNPTMSKLLNVPIPEYMHYYRDDDPEETFNYPGTCSAFWIDPLTKHFKMVVVKMVFHYGEFEKYGAVYSSIEGDWKEISLGQLKSIADYRLYCTESGGLVMRNVAYWSAYYYTPKGWEEVYCRYRAVVISFDFEQERFDSIEGPSAASASFPSLCNWKGSLSLVYLNLLEKRCYFYSRREGSWVNLFSICLTPNISRVYCLLKEVGENSKILLAETTAEELVLFDTRVGCVTLKSGDDKPDFHGYVAHGFVESLVFP